MFYGEQRDDTRQYFFTVWKKMMAKAPLLPLEAQISDVINLHPEYAPILSESQSHVNADFSVENGQSNPFLHMGMHLALREQLATDRPAGLRNLHQLYCKNLGDTHAAEHLMIESLGEILWEAQRNGTAPDEQRYLELIKQRIPDSFSR
jgi:hypothetical protein